ncbi:MAG: hypothetical protein M3Z37_04830 [Candidatus Eremiobacteraeota bacterium]|nr:hypothetical protein [Candidatus Eremiobacteraeota bacterium]
MTMSRARIALVALSIAASVLLCAAAAPYAHIPQAGDQVRFDASSSGQRQSWGFAQLAWLESFLRLSLEAAQGGGTAADSSSQVEKARDRAVTLNNGVRGVVTEVRAFHYRDRNDVTVHVLVRDGPMQNRIVWTTPAELVDAAGHRYLR